MVNKEIKYIYPVVIVLALHLVATVFCLYFYMRWLDIPMHLLGGAATAYLSLGILMHIKGLYKIKKQTLVLDALFVVGITAFVAISWEFYEYASDYILHAHLQIGLEDTLKDLLNGLVGSAVFALIYYFKKKK
jgi:hypothetical protein